MKVKFARNGLILCWMSFFAGNVSAAAYGDIAIDGDINDWSADSQINLPSNLPPYLASGDKVYGKYVTSPEPAYVFAVQSDSTLIGPNTTFWLNTDNNAATGYQIWGWLGGEEYYVNVYSDGQPYLYSGSSFGTFVAGPLEHAYNADKSVLEFAVPASLINSPEKISLLIDLNDSVFLPADYSSGQYMVSSVQQVLPVRTDFSKRVGIVYSETTKSRFFDISLPIQKAYSQLFMSMQHQAMMAGIPFDLLTEDDLTDISKLVNYDVLIFPYFAYVPADKVEAIHDSLYQAVYNYHIGIITAGDWMTNTGDGLPLSGDAYRNMKQLLGIGRVNGEGPVAITLNADDISHLAMKKYSQDETIISYQPNHWFNYFEAVPGQNVSVLAKQTVTGSAPDTYQAVLASETGGRNVHFANIEFMADPNLMWSALQWTIYGDQPAVALKMGRFSNLFVSRTDMDQSMFTDEVADNDGALLPLLKSWKSDYNFVGSFFINVGNNKAEGEWTNWLYSKPLYRSYIALGNEIGTHSYTHPEDTNILTPAEIEFQFNQSMNVIGSKLNPTWRKQNVRGAAVPGAPESLDTAAKIIPYLDYLTGGYSGVGAGYPNAFGYLTPSMNKVYFSPNMMFDFTLIEYGVPVYDPATGQFTHVSMNKTDAEQYWINEYHTVMNHASQPIVHWPWHDYGPTTGVASNLYSVSMFTGLLAEASNDNAEFATSADVAQRIAVFKNSHMTVSREGDVVTAVVTSPQAVGKFALDVDTASGETIKSVDGWYAYDNDSVFLDQDGGTYTIRLGTSADAATHITALPMRASLLSMQGDGNSLKFSVEGAGKVRVALRNASTNYTFSGADSVAVVNSNAVDLQLNADAVHNIQISPQKTVKTR